VADYREFVQSFQALASKPRIYVCRPCPVPGAGNYGINEAGVQQEIVRIDALAAEMNLGVIDMHAALVDKPQLLPDNVHPNIDGHREMAKAAFAVLTGKVARSRNLVPTEPGKSPNYWCTWSVQSYMQGQGAKTNDPILYQVAWKMMTDFADQFFPGLVMEHGNPSKDGPFNSYPGSGRVDPAYVEAGKRVIQYSEVMRLHDNSPQLGIPTMLDRLASILDAVKTKPAKTGYLDCEDEVTMAAVLGGTMGVMRCPMVGLRPGDDPDIFLKGPRNLKQRMDEVVRAVRWHRIAPAFGAGVMATQIDTKVLVDSYKFPAGEFWTSTEDWATTYASPYACMDKMVAQGAPARVTRGLPLPEVTCEGEPPYVLASLNPNGSVSIGTLGRLSPQRACYFPEADVSLNIGRITGNIGIFGYYKTLTLVLDMPLGEFGIWAQDLAGDCAVDITSKVLVEDNRLVFPGDLIKSIGLSAATPGDLSDPALVVEIVSK